ncbi:hypothetical protein pb186bvf_009473 [Paramecium bursaria]
MLYDDESDLLATGDIQLEIKQMEEKANLLQLQNTTMIQFSQLVLQSIRQIEQKITNIDRKLDRLMDDKENVQQNTRPKVQLGKQSLQKLPQQKSSIGKFQQGKTSIQRQVLGIKKLIQK